MATTIEIPAELPAMDVPTTPWDLIAQQRLQWRKLWNGDYSLRPPLIKLEYPDSAWSGPDNAWDPRRMVEDPVYDIQCQLARARHEIECLECSGEVGIPLTNTPALDLIAFGTGVLATAFGSTAVLQHGIQPHFEPAIHTAEEAWKLKKPNLLTDGILPQILQRIQLYNTVTRGEIIMTPCDTAGPWSIATSIWHYEDMLEAIHTDPDAVHYVMELVTESIIEWQLIQETYIGRWGRTHSSFSWPFHQRGVGIGDDVLVTVSPRVWDEFFLPYNNRMSREYGNMIFYHCCMGYDSHFASIAKTEGFVGFDATRPYNDLEQIIEVLAAHHGIWTCALTQSDIELACRLRDRVGTFFIVSGANRADAIRQSKELVSALETS